MLSLLGFDIGLIRYLPRETDKGGMGGSCFTIAAVAAALLSLVFLCGLHIWSPALLTQLWGLYFNPIIDHLRPISSPFSSIFPQS